MNQLKPKTDEGEEVEEAKKPDAIAQLIQCFQRAATCERTTMGITEDLLYMDYAEVMAKSIHVGEEDDDAGDDEEQPTQEVCRYRALPDGHIRHESLSGTRTGEARASGGTGQARKSRCFRHGSHVSFCL